MRIAEALGWKVVELPKEQIRELQREAQPSQKSYEAVYNGLMDIVQSFLDGVQAKNIVGKDNVLVFRPREGAEFVGVPEWRMGDFLRAPIRAWQAWPWSVAESVHEKHVFGDGTVAIIPAQKPGWAQVRMLAVSKDRKYVYRAWKGTVVYWPGITRPLIAFSDGYGTEEVPGDAVLLVFELLRETDLRAEYSIQGLYYQGVPGWQTKLKLRVIPGSPEQVRLWRAGAPMELFYPIAAHLGVGYKASPGYAGMLFSPKILPFLGLESIGENAVLAWTRRFKEGQPVVFNRRPDLPTGQSAVEMTYAGFSPIPRSVIAGGPRVALTGADYDGDFGLIFPHPKDGGLYRPYQGEGLQRKTLATQDYSSGLHRWAGQVHAARILGSAEVNARRYLDVCAASGRKPDPRLLENATLMIQVAVDRQKRDIAWPQVELPKGEQEALHMTDFFRLALPGGKIKPEGRTATQKIINRWRAWGSVSVHIGDPKAHQALLPLAGKVERILDAGDKRYPASVLATLAFALPEATSRPTEVQKLLQEAELADRATRLAIYDQLVARQAELGLVASMVTDHPELWLRLASEEELREVFSKLGYRPAKEEITELLDGSKAPSGAQDPLEVQEVASLDFSDLFA